MPKSSSFTPSRTVRKWSPTPLGTYTAFYLRRLSDQGYACGTINIYREVISHFDYWLSLRHIDLSRIDEAVISRFLDRHLPVCHCAKRCQRTRHTVRAALLLLLEMMRSAGHIAQARPIDADNIAIELQDFDAYLTDVCGLTPITRYYHVRRVRSFLVKHFKSAPISMREIQCDDVSRFLAHYTRHWTSRSRRIAYGALRSYFRFKALQGEPVAELFSAFPRFACWRLDRLPQVLRVAEIRRFLGAFDRSSVIGRRDYAIARCLVDLGLRAIEVARLRLDDFDWHNATVRIRGKGQRNDLMPLPEQTGRAIAQYLREGRPATAHRALFARHRAPLDSPITANMVRRIVRNAAVRRKVSPLTHGPHLLRHTAAQRLIRGGVTLKNIADFLRHRSLDTTTIYTKVDLPTLRRVALPWPGRHV